MRLRSNWLWLPAILCLPSVLAAQGDETSELASNPGMESGASGRPPDGWQINSYGELAASLTWDNRMARSGGASLRLACPAFRGGAAQAYLPIPPVRKGQVYTLRAWMRQEGLAGPVRLMIRDIAPPYHSYLGTTSLVAEDWTPVSVAAQSDADGASVGIFVNFQSAGALWIDDLSLIPGEHPLAADVAHPPVVKGNLVQNSSFETALQGWTMPEMVAVEPGGVDGGHCAHWLNKSPYMLEGRPVALKPNQQYTLSAYLKAPQEGTRVSLSVREVGGPDSHGNEFALTPDWTRYQFSFTAAPKENVRYYLSLARTAGADFHADRVQLEEGELTDWSPAAPLEAGFDLPRGLRFPYVGENVGFSVLAAGVGRRETAPLELAASDLSGKPLQQLTLPVTGTRVPVSLAFDRPGFVSLAIRDGEGRLLDEAQLCVLRRPDGAPDPFFGSHGSVGALGEHHAPTVLAKGGAGAWRLHDMGSYAQWFLAEPEKGRFQWFDEEVNALRDRGLQILGVFSRTAPWAGRDPGGEPVDKTAWPPRDWDEFGEYVFRVVDHYKDRIKHWEAWNEPWGRGFWAGTPEEYSKLLQVVYAQAKRADPDCIIIGGCFWPPVPDFTDRVLAAGAINYMDAVSYHHYVEPDAISMGQVRSWYRHMRERIDAVGGAHLPIWMTEGGTHCPSYYAWMDRRDQARAATETVAKHLIETKSLGAETFYYYHAWQEIGSPRMFHWLLHNHWVQLEYDGSPKPIYASYAAAAHLLSGTAPAGSVEHDRWRIHAFQRGEDTVLALWARGALLAAAELKLSLPGEVKAFDMMGADLPVAREGDALLLEVWTHPLYLVIPGQDAANVLVAARNAVGSE